MTAGKDPRTDRRIVVLAGTFQQFHAWCLDNDRNPRDPSLIYVSRWDRLMGMRDFDYVIYGTFWGRRDSSEIYNALKSRGGIRRA